MKKELTKGQGETLLSSRDGIVHLANTVNEMPGWKVEVPEDNGEKHLRVHVSHPDSYTAYGLLEKSIEVARHQKEAEGK